MLNSHALEKRGRAKEFISDIWVKGYIFEILFKKIFKYLKNSKCCKKHKNNTAYIRILKKRKLNKNKRASSEHIHYLSKSNEFTKLSLFISKNIQQRSSSIQIYNLSLKLWQQNASKNGWLLWLPSLISRQFVQIHTIFAKSYVFYELPIRMNLKESATPNSVNKPTHHWGLDKLY